MPQSLHIRMLISLLFLAGLTLPALPAQAQYFQMEMMKSKKQSQKHQSRWTLFDYLQQQRRVALMDYWLAAHRSATIFEFYMNGGGGEYDLATDGVLTKSVSYKSAGLGAYVTIFGLEGRYQDSGVDDWTRSEGALHLRLLGGSVQSTHLNVFYGMEKWSWETAGSDSLDMAFAGARINLYLAHVWGVSGSYRQYLDSTSNQGVAYSGQAYQYGTFLELGWLRLSADWFVEEINQGSGVSLQEISRQGLRGQVSFFF